jgi:glycosyltransferase involved in cell wall biosynthesis
VIAEAIKCFYEDGEEVCLHTLSGSEDVTDFFTHYHIPNEVEVQNYAGENVPSTLYQQLILNVLSRSNIRKSDLIFNSNNCLRFLPSETKTINYVHFPIRSTMDVEDRYNQRKYQIAALPLNTVLNLTRPNTTGKLFTNSQYTVEHTLKQFPKSEPAVLYPPCIDDVEFEGFSGSGVVSVGSFHPQKRQIFQLKVAETFPNKEFKIIGSVSSQSYYQQCVEYKENNDIDNAELLPNASDEKLERALEESQIFLHSMKDERFGIATVEGINRGCIPIAHDSGGQREVVPWDHLRYEDLDECVNVIRSVESGETAPLSEVSSHLTQFTNQTFRKQIRDIKNSMFDQP